MYYKFKEQKEQVSTDNGQTWTDTGVVRENGNVLDVYHYECACEGTCYEITPNVIISGAGGYVTDRRLCYERGCAHYVFRYKDSKAIITIKDLDYFKISIGFTYWYNMCGDQGQAPNQIEVYGLDDVLMTGHTKAQTSSWVYRDVEFTNIGGGEHQIAVYYRKLSSSSESAFPVVNFVDCG